jgi:hypothetical protein
LNVKEGKKEGRKEGRNLGRVLPPRWRLLPTKNTTYRREYKKVEQILRHIYLHCMERENSMLNSKTIEAE